MTEDCSGMNFYPLKIYGIRVDIPDSISNICCRAAKQNNNIAMDDDHLDPNDPLDAAWIDLCQCFHLNGRGDIPIQTSTPLTSTSALPELSPTSIDTLHSHDLMRSSLDLVQSRLNAHLREVIAPSFWSHFSHISDDDKVCFERFRAAVDDLFARVSAHMVYVRALDDLAVKTQVITIFILSC